MKKALKTKKALKRLDRVEALLSKVIDHVADELGVRDLLEAARSSVGRARAKAKPLAKNVKSQPKPKSAVKAKAPVKAKTSRKARSARSGGTAKRLRAATAEDANSSQSPAEEMAAGKTV